MTEEAATALYRSSLPLFLAFEPCLSAAASRTPSSPALSTLISQPPPPFTPLQSTRCQYCSSQVVGGLNGTVGLVKGRIQTSCDGCRRVSKGAVMETGKNQFGRLKKRRKLDQAMETKAGSGVKQKEKASVASASSRTQDRKSEAPPTTGIPPHVASSQPSHQNPQFPTQSPSHPPSSTSRPPAVPTSGSHQYTQPSLSNLLPPTAVSSRDPSSTQAKKRKRTSKPAGLAEMLEAKKRKSEAEKSASGARGLLGFLQELG
ncbi:hypothetical protein T439DRAFT_381570 [Meredithblackwellia eburnea MCA 4105]